MKKTFLPLLSALLICHTLTANATETASPDQARKIISDGFALAGSAKVATVEYYTVNGEFPKDNYSAGLAQPEAFTTKGVKSVTVMPQGNIVITYSELINSQAQANITLTPEGTTAITWTCSAQNIDFNLLPEECLPEEMQPQVASPDQARKITSLTD